MILVNNKKKKTMWWFVTCLFFNEKYIWIESLFYKIILTSLSHNHILPSINEEPFLYCMWEHVWTCLLLSPHVTEATLKQVCSVSCICFPYSQLWLTYIRVALPCFGKIVLEFNSDLSRFQATLPDLFLLIKRNAVIHNWLAVIAGYDPMTSFHPHCCEVVLSVV